MTGSLTSNGCRHDGTGFSQQGTVDWVSLSNSTFSFSLDLLSRLSKAGVDAGTLAIGRILFSHFKAPPEGQKKVTDAVSSLRAQASFSKVLWFGFGIKHIVRSFCETEQGVTCVAICACLCVSYDSEFRARVLQTMCGKIEGLEGHSPSLPQWAALVDVCAGSLARSNFPDILEGFCRLGRAQCKRFGSHTGLFRPTNVDILADALWNLSKRPHDTTASMTIRGGIDCAWLAAVAEWLFCFRVNLSTLSGEELYCSRYDDRSFQIFVVFDFEEQRSETALQIVNRTFRVPNGKQIPVESLRFRESFFGFGSSSWATILRDTFGDHLQALLHLSNINKFAILIARALPGEQSLKNFDNSHESPSTDRRHKNRDYLNSWLPVPEKSHGLESRICESYDSFLTKAVIHLPELRPLLNVNTDVFRAHALDLGLHIANFELCKCFQRTDWEDPNVTSDLEVDAGVPNDLCFYIIAITIFRFLWLLSNIDIDQALKPTSYGLLMIYDQVFNEIDIYNKDLYHYPQRHMMRPERMRRFDFWTHILETFTGHSNLPPSLDVPLAKSHEGVCIYVPAFENVDLAPQDHVRLRIIPGRVSWSGRGYDTIIYMKGLHQRRVETCHPERFLSNINSFKPSANLLIRESIHSTILEAAIELATTRISVRSLNIKKKLSDIEPHADDSGTSNWVPDSRFFCQYLFLPIFDDFVFVQPCRQVSMEVLAHSALRETQECYAGSCTDVEFDLFNPRGHSSHHRPKLNEWMIAIWDSSSNKSLSIVRSNLTMLYHLLGYFQFAIDSGSTMPIMGRPYLVRMGRCLLCFVKYSSGGFGGGPVHIHNFYNSRHEYFCLLDRWRDPQFGEPFPRRPRLKRKRNNCE